jgi:hypothetical protein
MKNSLFAIIAAWTFMSPVYGNNNLFLPGDAFFPTELTAEKLNQLQKADEPEFDYSSFDGYEGAFCGYAGYSRAKIRAVDRAFIGNLINVYAEIRELSPKHLVETRRDGKTVLEETNGIRVLFYPANFEFPKYRLGLRYNEKWVEETVAFGHRAQDIRICELVSGADAIMESWRDSRIVGGFELKRPTVKPEPGERADDPVVLLGSVKALVIPDEPLVNYAFPNRETTMTLWNIESQGVTTHTSNEGRWTVSESDSR